MKTVTGNEKIFSDRGVTPDVARDRGYIRYEKGDRDAIELFGAIPRRQRGATVTRRINFAGGYLMPRLPVDESLRRIMPEFGPADALEQEEHEHDHTWPAHAVKHILSKVRHDGPNVDGEHTHTAETVEGKEYKALPSGQQPHRHDSVKPSAWQAHVKGKRSHRGQDVTGLHPHSGDRAKYMFVPQPWRYASWRKPVGGEWSAHKDTDRHRARWHQDGTKKRPHAGEYGDHEHIDYVKDRRDSYAARIDVHPRSKRRLDGRTYTWCAFVLEGVLKGDSAVSNTGDDVLVVDVPSVTGWDCPELAPFARSFLTEVPVFVIPDSDWIDNPQVSLQAFALRQALRRYVDHRRVYVAAPTDSPDGHPCKHGTPRFACDVCRKRGLDDFMADGEPIESLVVVDREMSIEMGWFLHDTREWLTRLGTHGRTVNRTVALIEALALLADGSGTVSMWEPTIARFLDCSPDTVRRVVEYLIELDDPERSPFESVGVTWRELRATAADRMYGRVSMLKRRWFGGGEGWIDAPEFTIREDLRATETLPRPLLGDVL